MGPYIVNPGEQARIAHIQGPKSSYNAFFWFIAMMIILDFALFIFSILRRSNQRLQRLQPDYPQQNSESETYQGKKKTQKSIFSRLNKFIVYILKIMLLYSFCYFFYTLIFAGIYFVCNIYIGVSQQQSFSQPGFALHYLRDRSLENIYPRIPQQNDSIESLKTAQGTNVFYNHQTPL